MARDAGNKGIKALDWIGRILFAKATAIYLVATVPTVAVGAYAIIVGLPAWVILAVGIGTYLVCLIGMRIVRDPVLRHLARPDSEQKKAVPLMDASMNAPLRFESGGVEWEDTEPASRATATITGPYCPRCGSLLGYTNTHYPKWEPLREDHRIGGFPNAPAGLMACPSLDGFRRAAHVSGPTVANLREQARSTAIGLKRAKGTAHPDV